MSVIRYFIGALPLLAGLLSACGSEPRPEPAVGSPPAVEPSPPAPAPGVSRPPPAPEAATDTEPASAEPVRTAPDVFAAPRGLIRLTNPDGAPEPSRSTCGDYQVDYALGPAPNASRVVVVDAKGKTARELAPKGAVAAWYPQWCFDVTGDGIPELALTSRTSGKTWLFRHTLFSLSQPIRELLVHQAGQTTGHALDPIDLDGKGAFELVDTDDVLTKVAPAERTRFIPVVFAYEKDRYVRATRRFGDYIAKVRADVVSTCQNEVCWEDGGGYLLALSLLIGDWDRFKADTPVPSSLAADLEVLRKKLDPKLK